MKNCCSLRKISSVATRALVPSFTYQPRYRTEVNFELAMKYNAVDEENRYESLEILLKHLSGHVGRRQYKMLDSLEEFGPKLKSLKLDWHDIKHMKYSDVLDVCSHLKFTASQRIVFLTAVEAKVCGVLTKSGKDRAPGTMCLANGIEECGWRCGRRGHGPRVYFEDKGKAPDSIMMHRAQVRTPAEGSIVAKADVSTVNEHGVLLELRNMPNFAITGRSDNNPLHPRIWTAPVNPVYHVTCIGFEFRVHPADPRAKPQIVDAAAQWEIHAKVVQSVLWEMLELYGVERSNQPLDLTPGEMGSPDDVEQHARSFVTQRAADEVPGGTVTVQRRIKKGGVDGWSSTSSSCSAVDASSPWFLPPKPQQFEKGVPIVLPFAPSVILKTTFRQIIEDKSLEDQLNYPVLDVALLTHPNACFWWSEEDEAKCLKHILEYAKRVPFALPFNLYLRVDQAKGLRSNDEGGEALIRRQKEKEQFFNLRTFNVVPPSNNVPHTHDVNPEGWI